MEQLSHDEIITLKGISGLHVETKHQSYHFLCFRYNMKDKEPIPTFDEYNTMIVRLERLGLIQIGTNYIKITPYGLYVVDQLKLFENL